MMIDKLLRAVGIGVVAGCGVALVLAIATFV